jgi:hypothetical protein
MSPQTHNTLSPFPFPRSVISEVAGPSQFPHQTSRDTHRGLAPERKQWPRKFWIYESPPSSSQNSKSNTSSGSKSTSTGSETPEERRVRTASPYGAFFAEEMEIDTPAESRPFRPGDGQEEDTSGTITPLSLAENSRRSQPPLSWRQGHLDHRNDRNSQYDPQVATAVSCDTRQTGMVAQGRLLG